MGKHDDINFISVWKPSSDIQAGLIRSTMEREGIACYVNNENMSGMGFGGMIIGIAGMDVMVPEDRVAEAKALINELGVE